MRECRPESLKRPLLIGQNLTKSNQAGEFREKAGFDWIKSSEAKRVGCCPKLLDWVTAADGSDQRKAEPAKARKALSYKARAMVVRTAVASRRQ